MNRRMVLKGLAGAFPLLLTLGSSALAASAQRTGPVDVVEVLNFACPHCRAAEAVDGSIKSAVEAQGGKFIWAPIPVLKSDSGEAEIEYYAARDLSPDFAQAFKASMYKGAQDMQIVLQTPMDIYTWTQQDMPNYTSLLSQMFQVSKDPKYRDSVGKALLLAQQSGVTLLPGYIFVRDNTVVGMVDRATAGSDSPVVIQRAVLAELKKLTSKEATRPSGSPGANP